MGRLFTKMLSTYSDRSITGLDHIVIFTNTRSAPSYEFLERSPSILHLTPISATTPSKKD